MGYGQMDQHIGIACGLVPVTHRAMITSIEFIENFYYLLIKMKSCLEKLKRSTAPNTLALTARK